MSEIMVMEAVSAASNGSEQMEINPYMSEDTVVVLIALLCATISLMGLVLVVPWHYILRSCEDQMAARLANTGLKKKNIKALPSVIYSKVTTAPAAECTICLAEFLEGEKLRVLPRCKHTFHMTCVDKWLVSHSSCPSCRNCLLQREAYVAHCGTNQIQPSRSEACVVEINRPRPRAQGDKAILPVS